MHRAIVSLIALLVGLFIAMSAGGLLTGSTSIGSEGLKTTDTTKRISQSGHDIRPLDEATINKLAADLSEEDARIILAKGTEAPFCGTLLDNKKEGTYVCKLCGLPLFSSDSKFTSGTGWPSFHSPYDPDHIHEERDTSHGMLRSEILCQRCGGHLGHVFDDGPRPTGLRYCLNSASLEFYEKGTDLPARSQPMNVETAYFAGGCFWGVEDQFQQVPGVIDAVSGYQGGHVDNPTYKQVCYTDTGHAESVKVVYDPSQISYEELLGWFFKLHDPTQLNRQGPDFGTQYRSAIFATDDTQLEQARAFIAQQQASGRYKDKKIVTQVNAFAPFYEAEEYHQDYHAKHGGSCALPGG